MLKLFLSVFLVFLIQWVSADDVAKARADVTLSRSGTGKKQLLQFAVPKGASTSMAMKMNMKISGVGSDMSLPVVSKQTIACLDVDSQGNMTIESTIDEMSGAPGFEKMAGVKVVGKISPAGNSFESRIVGVLPAELASMKDQMTQMTEQVAIELPPVPVAVGATWTSTKVMDQLAAGVKMSLHNVHTILKISGSNITLKTTTTIEGSMPNGNIKGSGFGESTINLKTLAANGHSSMTQTMTMSGGKKRKPMVMNQQIDITISSP